MYKYKCKYKWKYKYKHKHKYNNTVAAAGGQYSMCGSFGMYHKLPRHSRICNLSFYRIYISRLNVFDKFFNATTSWEPVKIGWWYTYQSAWIKSYHCNALWELSVLLQNISAYMSLINLSVHDILRRCKNWLIVGTPTNHCESNLSFYCIYWYMTSFSLWKGFIREW